jgi:hypothetical protein
MVSRLYSLMDLVWQKVQKKVVIMPTLERGVSIDYALILVQEWGM